MKYLFLLLLVFLPVAFFWYSGSFYSLTLGGSSTLIALARLAGLLAAFLALLQLVLIGRVKWLDREFGHDKLARFHQTNGKLVYSFLILHVFLVLWGYGATRGVSFLAQLNDFILTSDDLAQAVMAFGLFTFVVALSIAIVRRRLKYEFWYYVHLLTYAAIALSFGHQTELGEDFSQAFFTPYWYLLYAFAFGHLIYFRFVRPLLFFSRHRFQVLKVEAETPSVNSVYIGGREIEDFKFEAGQFMRARFLARGFWTQAHPFSFSLPPGKGHLRFSIKESGDFTKKIKELPVGTQVLIDGPHGVFTLAKSQREKILAIAGGIGITPLRSLCEEGVQKGKDIVLLYSNKLASDIPLKRELEELEKTYSNFKVILVVTDDPSWVGEEEKLNLNTIQKLVPDWQGREIFLCGPGPMMKAIREDLKKASYPSQYLHFEEFAW